MIPRADSGKLRATSGRNSTKSTTSKTAVAPIVVTSEAELNKAIAVINASGQSTTIDVQRSFTLTGNATAITASLTMLSSNGSAIDDGGFVLLDISNGAIVGVALQAAGSGTNAVHGQGENTTLKGLTGGAVAAVDMDDGGLLIVDNGQTFKTGAVKLLSPFGCEAVIRGTLDNSGPMFVVQGTVNVGGGQMGDLDVAYQSFLTIKPNTVFKAGKVKVRLESQILSDGTGTLVTDGPLMVYGVGWRHSPAQVLGMNVGDITLIELGTFGSTQSSHGTPGGSAGAVTNISGLFELGHEGLWTIGSYTQQTGGTLKIHLPDFSGKAPFLNISGKATFSGGKVAIGPDIYYLPPGTQNQKIKLITAAGGLSPSNLSSLVTFSAFPTGITPSLLQDANNLYLILTVTG